MTDDSLRGDCVYLYLKDEGSGVAWDKIYAQNGDGETFKPDKYDAKAGWIAIRYPDSSINVFIPDKSENVLHLALTIK